MSIAIDGCTEQEQATELARYFVALQKQIDSEAGQVLFDKCTEDWAGKPKEVLSSLIDQVDFLFSHAPGQEVDGIISVLLSLISKVETECENELICRLRDSVTSTPCDKEKALLRLRILNNIYNVHPPNSISCFHTFTKIVSFARETDNTQVVIPHLIRLPSFLGLWQCESPAKLDLLRVAVSLLWDAEEWDKALQMSVYYWKHFEDASSLPDSKETATFVLRALVTPKIVPLDFLPSLRAVASLRDSDSYSSVWKFLVVMLEGTVSDLSKFRNEYPSFIEDFELDLKSLERKMLFLTLLKACQGKQVVSFSLLAKELEISEDQVERVVIEAVSENLLSARLDTLSSTVTIRNVQHRSFGVEEWKVLQQQLYKWKDTISLVKDKLEQQQMLKSQLPTN